MRRLLLLAMSILAVPAGASASGGGHVVVSYGVSWDGATDPSAGTAASAKWSVDARIPRGNSDGMLPAKLIEATQAPFVTGGETPDACTETRSLTGISDPAGRLRFSVTFELLRGRALVQAYPSDVDNGMVHLRDVTACPGYADSVQESDSPAWQLFSGVAVRPEWTVTRVKQTNVWVGSAKQQRDSEIGGSYVQSITLRLTVAPATFNALCKYPTIRQLHSARTRAAAVRLLHRSGLTVERGSPTALPVRYVKKGHFFVTTVTDSGYDVCGDGVTLARSLGPVQGGGVGQM